MTILNSEQGKFVAQDRRATAEHEAEIERIKSGELGVDWVEGSTMGAGGFTVTDDGLWIGPEDRVYRVVRGERNLGLVDESANRIVILNGNRVEGWLVSLTANELQEQNAQHTRNELQARQFEAWEAATTKAINRAKKAPVVPAVGDTTGRSFGDRVAGSVARVERYCQESGLEIKAAVKDGPLLVWAGSPKPDADKMGEIGVRRIGQIQGTAGRMYYELEKLGRAWGSLCDMPKCSSPAETLRAGIVLCEEHSE